MISSEVVAGRWWIWWGNPFQGIHADYLRELKSQGLSPSDSGDYKAVLRARRVLELVLVPDEAMNESGNLMAMGLLPHAVYSDQLSDLACVTFDESILKVRPQDWEELYGVHDTEKIRTLIAGLRGLTPGLESIRFVVAPIIQQSTRQLKLIDSVWLVVALYLRQFQPVFIKRWRLTVPESVLSLLADIPPVPKDLQEEFKAWVESQILSVVETWQKQFEIPEIEFENLQDDYAEFDQKNSDA